jgi:hypothetical protein
VTFSDQEPALTFVPHPRASGGFFSVLCSASPAHELRITIDVEETAP